MKKWYSLLLATLVCQTFIFAQSASLTGSPIDIEPYIFGYNVNNFRGGPNWTDPEMSHTATRLFPGIMRYPGGTTSNYWDWRTGRNIVGSSRYRPEDIAITPETFIKGIPADAPIVYCINMARPTPATGVDVQASYEVLASQATLDKKIIDILEGIQAFADAGHPLEFVELGNEFYIGAQGGTATQGGVYSGDIDLYLNHANQLAQAINDRYPNIEIAIIGESDRDSRRPEWNRAVYDALANGTLNNIDAITLHWYTGPGQGVNSINNASDSKEVLRNVFNKAEKIKERDYDKAPDGLKLWITEYNVFSDPNAGSPIEGTWVNGMFGATLGLLYTMIGEDIDMLNVHVLKGGANLQWNMLVDDRNLSGNGVAVGAVARAAKGMTQAQTLAFEGIPDPTFEDNRPSLYGVKFWNDMKESLVIINSTEKPKNGASINGLLTGSANRQLSQYYDPTPWTQDVSETSGITYKYDDNQSQSLNIQPFSITVITQERENLLTHSSFEQGQLNWSIEEGTVQTARKNAVSGFKSLRLDDDRGRGLRSVFQTVPISPGQSYKLSAQMRTNLSAGKGRLQVRFFNANGQEVGSRITSGGLSGIKSYRTRTLNFTPPADASEAAIYLQSANSNGSVWFDDIILASSGSRFDGKDRLVIRAKGDTGDEQMELLLDDGTAKSWNVTTQWADYTFDVDPESDIKIAFTNDFSGNVDGVRIDRNLQIDYISIDGKKLQAENQEVNTGSWNSASKSCGGAPSEYLYCGGFIAFDKSAPLTRVKELFKELRKGLKIYPNPATESTTIQLPAVGISFRLQILDMNGQLHEEFELREATQIDLSTDKMPRGVYIVRVTDGNREWTDRLLIR